jgi:hypothetical protein
MTKNDNPLSSPAPTRRHLIARSESDDRRSSARIGEEAKRRYGATSRTESVIAEPLLIDMAKEKARNP